VLLLPLLQRKQKKPPKKTKKTSKEREKITFDDYRIIIYKLAQRLFFTYLYIYCCLATLKIGIK
jgi:hypothetical protein